MPARISVGSTFADAWYICCWVFGGLFLLIGLIVAAAVQELVPAAILAGIGVVFFLFAVIRGMGISSRRRWLTATKSGFVLEDKRGEFEFDDEVITDLGTWAKVKFSNGEAKGVTRTGALFVAAEEFASRIEFKYDYGLNEDDPLGKFEERNLARLTEAALETLADGKDVSGDDWVLDRDGLTYAEKGEDRTVRLDKLSAVDIVDGKVCVWKAGEPLPVVKVPAPSPNALILYRILGKRFEGKPPTEDADDGTLGRVIFERDSSLSGVIVVLLIILAVVFTLGGIGMVVASFNEKPREPALLFVALGVFLLAGLMVFATLRYRKSIFRCHALGVSRITSRGEQSMRFKDVRVFTYSGVRNYVNGAYQGTAISMKFEAAKGETLAYSATIKNADDELDNLREHVSRVIAEHMRKKLADGKTVPWTDRVRFTPDGLEIAGRSGFFGKASDDLFIPFGKIADATLNAGQFALLAEGRKKPVYETPVSTANFFPGYVLLILIRFPPQPEAKPRRADDSDPDDFKKPTRRPRDDFDD